MKAFLSLPVAVMFAAGFAIATMCQTRATAQPMQGPVAGRFQISAFAGQSGGSVFHGCYRVDTATGELWLLIPDQAPKRVQNAVK